MKKLIAFLIFALVGVNHIQAESLKSESFILCEIPLEFQDLQYQEELEAVDILSRSIVLDGTDDIVVTYDEESDLYTIVFVRIYPAVLELEDSNYQLELSMVDQNL